MANKVEPQQAIDALHEHFGTGSLTASRDAGRDMMADALQQRLGLSKGDARDMIRTLEEAHSLRWVPGRDSLTAIAPSAGNPVDVDKQPLPVQIDEGHWQF